MYQNILSKTIFYNQCGIFYLGKGYGSLSDHEITCTLYQWLHVPTITLIYSVLAVVLHRGKYQCLWKHCITISILHIFSFQFIILSKSTCSFLIFH